MEYLVIPIEPLVILDQWQPVVAYLEEDHPMVVTGQCITSVCCRFQVLRMDSIYNNSMWMDTEIETEMSKAELSSSDINLTD